MCVRISKAFLKFFAGGWAPRLDTQPFVEWDRRIYNALADHAANATLDLGQDWCRGSMDNIVWAQRVRANIRVRIDGARRVEGPCAAGVVIIAYAPHEGQEAILYRGGRMLGKLPSAFAAELLALEFGTEIFARIMLNMPQ